MPKNSKMESRIGELLIEMGMIKEEDFSVALGCAVGHAVRFLRVRFVNPKKDQNLEKLVNYEFAKKNLVLPLSKHHAFFDLRGI